MSSGDFAELWWVKLNFKMLLSPQLSLYLHLSSIHINNLNNNTRVLFLPIHTEVKQVSQFLTLSSRNQLRYLRMNVLVCVYPFMANEWTKCAIIMHLDTAHKKVRWEGIKNRIGNNLTLWDLEGTRYNNNITPQV